MAWPRWWQQNLNFSSWNFEFSTLEIIKKNHVENVFLLDKQGVDRDNSRMAEIPKIMSDSCIISRKIREKGNFCEGEGDDQSPALLLLKLQRGNEFWEFFGITQSKNHFISLNKMKSHWNLSILPRAWRMAKNSGILWKSDFMVNFLESSTCDPMSPWCIPARQGWIPKIPDSLQWMPQFPVKLFQQGANPYLMAQKVIWDTRKISLGF